MKNVRRARLLGILVILGVAVFLSPLVIWRLTRDRSFVSLPSPDLTGHLPLSDALAIEVIDNGFRDEPITVTDVSQILWAMQGITHIGGLRTAPSAGGTYPLELFVATNQVSNLEAGFYQYKPATHLLTPVPVNESVAFVDCFVSEDRNLVEGASAVFLVFAEYGRTTQRYGPRGVQYVHLEVGHVLENALLQMASLSLRTKPILTHNVGMLRELMNTTYTPLLVLPVGVASTLNQDSMASPISDLEEMTVEQAIRERRSIREYLNTSLPSSALDDILGNCTLVPLLVNDTSWFDLRLVLRDVVGLESGLYDFHLENGSLFMESEERLTEELFEAGLSQPWIRDAQANLVISADSESCEQGPHPDRRWRSLLYSVGMLSQIVYLKCTSMGLGTVSIGGLYENQVAQVVQAPDGFIGIYIMPIGML
ncbi:SagB/ThcOx family dehydrogenase [Candidatus Thorarchaeota archaeon]|nr:MAG: SagB/ThcOx family dehydrogenase [Candidatus Thorarchaeota archaeon]